MAIMTTDFEELDFIAHEPDKPMAEVETARGISTPDERRSLDAPRARLKAVASGKAPLRVEDVESVLVDHALDADERSKSLGATASELVDFLMSSERPDPEATLKIVKSLSSLAFKNASEMRKSLELATRIQRRPPPRVQIVGVGGQVNVGDKQINTNSVELGDQ